MSPTDQVPCIGGSGSGRCVLAAAILLGLTMSVFPEDSRENEMDSKEFFEVHAVVSN